MDWINSLFIEHSVIQAIVVLSIICAIGLALGKIKIFGVALGATFVFFAGIVAGHFGITIDPQMLLYAESFGLVLFVYALGLQVGPGFFSSLGKSGLKLNLLATLVVLLGVVMTLAFHWTTGVSLPDMVGIFSGAVTNSPALGAAQQTLKQLADPQLLQSDLALGFAVAYPLGIVGVIVALALLHKLLARHIHFTADRDDKSKHSLIAELLVTQPGIIGKNIQELARETDRPFVISRLWRGKVSLTPASDTVIQSGDRLLVITSEADLDPLVALVGECSQRDWNREDIDWEHLDRNLTTRRMVITRPEFNGKKLGMLRLRNRYKVNVTRIYRAGIVLIPTPGLVLQMGDRLNVVGENSALNEVEQVLGNSVKDLDEPNLVAVFVGMTLGLLLGSIPIFIPGMSFPVKLGLAGGPIIVGILVGAFGPRVNMLTYTTVSANWMLRALGLALFMGCLGLDAGAGLFAVVFRPEGMLWLGLGFALTVVPLLLVGMLSVLVLKMDFGSVAGMLCGSMSNAMALNYINPIVEGDTPSVAYASVYPLTMFLRVITAQLILLLFL